MSYSDKLVRSVSNAEFYIDRTPLNSVRDGPVASELLQLNSMLIACNEGMFRTNGAYKKLFIVGILALHGHK